MPELSRTAYYNYFEQLAAEHKDIADDPQAEKRAFFELRGSFDQDVYNGTKFPCLMLENYDPIPVDHGAENRLLIKRGAFTVWCEFDAKADFDDRSRAYDDSEAIVKDILARMYMDAKSNLTPLYKLFRIGEVEPWQGVVHTERSLVGWRVIFRFNSFLSIAFDQDQWPGWDGYTPPAPEPPAGVSYLFKSDGTTLVREMEEGDVYSIPKHTIFKSDGSTVYSTAEFDEDTTLVPARVRNTSGSLQVLVEAGEMHTLSNVDHIDSTGATVSLPAGEAFTATAQIKELVLEVQFSSSDADETNPNTITAYAAGDYTSESLSNIDTVVYDVNGSTVALPFSLVVGDVLTITITRTAAGDASVTLIGTYT